MDRTILLTNGEYTIREPRRSSTIGSLEEESSFIAKEPARLRYIAAGDDSGVVLEEEGVSIVSNAELLFRFACSRKLCCRRLAESSGPMAVSDRDARMVASPNAEFEILVEFFGERTIFQFF